MYSSECPRRGPTGGLRRLFVERNEYSGGTQGPRTSPKKDVLPPKCTRVLRTRRRTTLAEKESRFVGEGRSRLRFRGTIATRFYGSGPRDVPPQSGRPWYRGAEISVEGSHEGGAQNPSKREKKKEKQEKTERRPTTAPCKSSEVYSSCNGLPSPSDDAGPLSRTAHRSTSAGLLSRTVPHEGRVTLLYPNN